MSQNNTFSFLPFALVLCLSAIVRQLDGRV